MTPETIKALCPEFCLLIDEWSGGKNIPAFLVVKALAEARQALEEISKAVDCPWPNWCDACNEPEDIKHEPSWEAKIAKAGKDD